MAPHAYYEFAHEAPIVRDHLQPPSTRLRIFISYALLDLAINASAGAAAAATGAHVSGIFDARALQVGALAGLLKSAWHSTTCLIGWHFVHRFYNLAMVAVTNDFVFAELLVVAIAAITLGEGASEIFNHDLHLTSRRLLYPISTECAI
ncbi:hypothetical protein EKO27_g11375 [Xylaria grammica]|uniref:Uncharacterized protein n=1 Tax=Xylaria grammica TaxID=363999 RepID=A0A439CNL4_9PEZI|nr:hypothetical protein EKO27_g11375 [Xylaria grammica]